MAKRGEGQRSNFWTYILIFLLGAIFATIILAVNTGVCNANLTGKAVNNQDAQIARAGTQTTALSEAESTASEKSKAYAKDLLDGRRSIDFVEMRAFAGFLADSNMLGSGDLGADGLKGFIRTNLRQNSFTEPTELFSQRVDRAGRLWTEATNLEMLLGTELQIPGISPDEISATEDLAMMEGPNALPPEPMPQEPLPPTP